MRRWRPSMSASSASAPMRNESTSRTPPMGISEVKGEVLCECTKRSEEHTSELQSQSNLVCRLLLEKKKETHHGSRNINLLLQVLSNVIDHLKTAAEAFAPPRIALHALTVHFVSAPRH